MSAIARALAGNMRLLRLDLSKNNLSDHGNDYSGVVALARALATNFTLARVDLRFNSLDGPSEEGVDARAKLAIAQKGRERSRTTKPLELLL